MIANAGVSKVTVNKQNFLTQFMNVFNRYHFIYDTQAGPGLYENKEGNKVKLKCGNKANIREGSPMIFANHLDSAAKVYAVEKDKRTFDLLQLHLIKNNNVKTLLGEQEHWTPVIYDLEKNYYGLVYIDPNGSFEWKTMHDTFAKCKNTDFLINISSVGHKRQAKAHAGKHANIGLQIAKLNRKYWYINIPNEKENRMNWTRIFATNEKITKSRAAKLGLIPVETTEQLQIFVDFFDANINTLSKYITVKRSKSNRSLAAIKANKTRKKLSEVLRWFRKGDSGVSVSKKVGVPVDYVFKVKKEYDIS